MNKRSYILGIGAGLIFSSCVFFAVYSVYGSKEANSEVVITIEDDEIIKRAEKLGMIFIKDALEEKLIDEHINEEQIDYLENEVNKYDEVITREIRIEKGFTSYDVSKLLESEKIVEKKEDFDEFMYEEKASKKINYGVFVLKSDMSHDEILDIIAK